MECKLIFNCKFCGGTVVEKVGFNFDDFILGEKHYLFNLECNPCGQCGMYFGVKDYDNFVMKKIFGSEYMFNKCSGIRGHVRDIKTMFSEDMTIDIGDDYQIE